MTSPKVPCPECGTPILATTVAANGGRCIPCANGTRRQLEAGKVRAAEDRRRHAEHRAARDRILRKDTPTLGDFAGEEDPMSVLWPHLVELVYRRSSASADLAALSAPARTIYLAGILDGEVYNGGFQQFLTNSSGAHAHATVTAMTELGALAQAGLLERAIGLLPDARTPIDRQARFDLATAVDDARWDSLDREYYALGEIASADLGVLLVEFLRRHAASFVRSYEP
jgi:hypothetical protein